MEEKTLPVYFGEWLKHRRKQLDLTQVELAERVGCSASGLRKIESGERRPSKQLASLLAHSLSVPAEEQATFIRVARGELNLERLRFPGSSPAVGRSTDLKPTTPQTNLPLQLTPFVGREVELAALEKLMADGQCRLLTITGMGGIGKTRLAVELAFRNKALFPGGVVYVSLASVSAPEFLIPTIAEAFGFTFSGSLDPQKQLLNLLAVRARQPLLLVLDNLEHLLLQHASASSSGNPAIFLSELLQRAQEVKVLATSRERINIQGEWTFELHGLPVPVDDLPDSLEDFSSVALFMQRARQVNADFDVLLDERLSLAKVCQLVEGTPLAIELAAAWIGILSLNEIAQEIQNSLDFLAAAMRDIPERHRSLRATFDHSWKLLSLEERKVMCRLSVFQGGFTRDAAWDVAGASLEVLSNLVSKSFLRRQSTGRYTIHELLRQYTAQQATKHPEEQAAAEYRHSTYYAGLVESMCSQLIGEHQMDALEETSAEMNNIRASWRHAVLRGLVPAIRKSIRGLWTFYEIRGWFQEGDATFQRAVKSMSRWATERANPDVEVLRSYLLANSGWFRMRMGEWGEASRIIQQSISQIRPLDAPQELSDMLHFAATALWGVGNYSDAIAACEEKIALDMQLEDPWGLGMAKGMFGLVLQSCGDYHRARELMRSAHQLFEECGDIRMVGISYFHRAGVEINLKEYASAQQMLEESMALSITVGDVWGIAMSRLQLGFVAQAQGEHAEAVGLFRKTLDLARDIHEHWSSVQSLNGMGNSLLMLGEEGEAGRAFQEALVAARDAEIWSGALEAVVGLATLCAKQGFDTKAMEWALFALAHSAASLETKSRSEKLCTELKARMSTEEVEAAGSEARAKPFDQVIKELLIFPLTGA